MESVGLPGNTEFQSELLRVIEDTEENPPRKAFCAHLGAISPTLLLACQPVSGGQGQNVHL